MYRLLRERKKHSKVTESLDAELPGGLRLHDKLPDDTGMEEAAEARILACDALARIRALPRRSAGSGRCASALPGSRP